MARQRNKYTLSTIDQSFNNQLDQWKREALPQDKQRIGLKLVLMTYDGIIDLATANRLLKDLNPPK